MSRTRVHLWRIVASVALGTVLSVVVSIYLPLALSGRRTVSTSGAGHTRIDTPAFTKYEGSLPWRIGVDPYRPEDFLAHTAVLRSQRYSGVSGVPISDIAPDTVFVAVVEWGWPMRSLWGCSGSGDNGNNRSHLIRVPEWSAFFLPPPDAIHGRFSYIPTTPIWAGLLANAGVWSAVCWLLMTGFAGVRAWNRQRRGACQRCGYDLRGLGPGATCPECGKVGA